jgi:hypothetical protein
MASQPFCRIYLRLQSSAGCDHLLESAECDHLWTRSRSQKRALSASGGGFCRRTGMGLQLPPSSTQPSICHHSPATSAANRRSWNSQCSTVPDGRHSKSCAILLEGSSARHHTDRPLRVLWFATSEYDRGILHIDPCPHAAFMHC